MWIQRRVRWGVEVTGTLYIYSSACDHMSMFGLTTGSLVEPAGEGRGEGGLSRSGVPSRGDARTRRRARGRGREREETLRKTRGREEKLEEKRRKKNARATRWKTRGDLLLFRGS